MFIFLHSIHHSAPPKSLWLKKLLLSRCRSHFSGRSSIQPGFLVLYLLVAAHSNPLINFPAGSLVFKFPSSLMNSIPNLSNLLSNYSTLYHVLPEKKIIGTIFMLALLVTSDLHGAFPLRHRVHTVSSKHSTTPGSDFRRRRTKVKVLSVVWRDRRAVEGNTVMDKTRLN